MNNHTHVLTTDGSASRARNEVGKKRRPRKAALAGFLGGTLEYYDFFIYTTAASLVFNHVFFAPGDPTVALIQSFAIFGVGYVFRPLGAVLFGHLGDRFGRRNTLVMTLALMGGATFLIGCLPTYQQIGWWAPALLTLMRVLQGLKKTLVSAKKILIPWPHHGWIHNEGELDPTDGASPIPACHITLYDTDSTTQVT